MRLSILLLAGLGVALFACDDSPPPKNPFDPPPKETNEPPKVTEVPKPSGPPHIAIDDLGPKIGFTRVLLDKPEGREKLAKELEDAKEHFEGKEAKALIIRKAKMTHVVALFEGLSKIGVTKIVVATESREEYPKELTFTPQSKLSDPKPCTVVAMVLADRGTAVWKIAGGTATKRAKGFAGPDLTMTGDTLERYAKACKDSSTLLVSAAEGIEWGLAYDLAASTKKLEGPPFDTIVLLKETPIAGRKVSL